MLPPSWLSRHGGPGELHHFRGRQPKTNKLLEGTPIIHLELKLFIADIKKLLEYKHLEKDQRINPLAPCVALPLVYVASIKEGTK